jgi:hypothetical protein
VGLIELEIENPKQRRRREVRCRKKFFDVIHTEFEDHRRG